jgi:hypothetical protein
MLLLASTSDVIRIDTSGTANIDVHASWVDKSGTTVTPGRTNTTVSSATTTTVCGSPGSSTYRTVKTLHIRNRHATTANTVTVEHFDGTTGVELISVSLLAGYVLHYDEGAGWELLDALGRSLQNSGTNGSGAAVNSTNLVVLASDVTNNNAVANTIADVTGLSFSVTAGETYFFRFNIQYTAAATTTGSRWSVNGPASPTALRYMSTYSLTSTTQTTNHGLTAYDTPAASNATSAATGGNTAIIEGFITPSADGTVIARFASEVSSSAIVARAGSLLEWYRVL